MPPSAPDSRPFAGCLLLVLLIASSSIQAPAAKEESHIISVLRPPPSLGEKIRVPCEGITTYPESGIMYWLANGTFVDQLYPNGTVKEGATIEEDSKVTRELIFSALTAQDLRTKFDCILTDPSGVFHQDLQWGEPKRKSCRC